MDEMEKRLLVKLQKEFPLCPQPFLALAKELNSSEEEIIARIRGFKEQGTLRQISAIFDSRALGYQSALVAAKVAPAQLLTASQTISAHPGVSHNYERGHHYNLWFTLALPPEFSFEEEVARVLRAAGCEQWMVLPSIKTFKIEVVLDNSAASNARNPDADVKERPKPEPRGALSEQDKAFVRALQEDLPVQSRPFLPMAEKLGTSEESLLAWAEEGKRTGILRRFAGILRHRKAGFAVNGMGVWNVPAERMEACGKLFASYQAVSHCYERPVTKDWPYGLYTMVHAKSLEVCGGIFEELSREAKISDYKILCSLREFKKERIKYFCEAAPALAAVRR